MFVVAADHPALPGHFPGRPVVPGVTLLDEALAAVHATYGRTAPLRLLRVKFTAPAAPGERITVLARHTHPDTLQLSCVADARQVLAAVIRFDDASPVDGRR